MRKKIVALCLVVCMLAIIAISGTMAYFTDTEEANNVFTVGNVDVTLYESYLHRTADSYDANVKGDEYKVTTYRQGGITDDEIIESAKMYQDYLNSKQLMPGVSINKMPYVKNEGKSDAYIRIRVMIPAYLDQYLDSSVYCTTATQEEFDAVLGNDTETSGVTYTDANGVMWDVYTFTRKEALKPGEMTEWNVWNTITMDTDVTNQDFAWAVDQGLIDATNSFGVKVEVDAIQSAGFTSRDDAWKAFGEQKKNSIVTYEEYTPDYELANSVVAVKAIEAALTSGSEAVLEEDVVTTASLAIAAGQTLDGNGQAMHKDASAETNSGNNIGLAVSGGTIKDITITGTKDAGGKGFRAIYIAKATENVVVENADITALYPINTGSGNSNTVTLTVKDSSLNGWTSFAGLASASFENVKFGAGAGYAQVRPYINTTFTKCYFTPGVQMDVADGKDGSATGVTLTFVDCYYGETLITANNVISIFNMINGNGAWEYNIVVDGINVTWPAK